MVDALNEFAKRFVKLNLKKIDTSNWVQVIVDQDEDDVFIQIIDYQNNLIGESPAIKEEVADIVIGHIIANLKANKVIVLEPK